MTNAHALRSIRYNDAPEALRRQFALLHQRVDPDDAFEPGDTAPVLHDPRLDAMSFYVSAPKSRDIASYAAVVRKTISHAGERFSIGGLSWVATDPAHRRAGLGTRTVAAATQWMEASGIDIGVFTCDPPLASFYARAGRWPIASRVTLIGSRADGALRSDTLNKVVLMRLFSAKARAAEAELSRATIDLDLPLGQFL
ncbi:GNAT family N-acetyltransferase [Burkholderia oklahomensis]|uniref:Acetyltransferase family protein n=1 Tax=Burkholderia oklahomensis TaxID=342113 RepID=A0AAI8FKY5_9BURK|nr:GNAT family N-acetyltransferase [Burkholderia oklahomensis]AIO64966.1 acetyltransferase family protein [Burkholderia oklahomensis]AOI41707.1 acetyltransferase [Burkholderia oklahomensis EO147]KUY69308.1 acetyltransferase [Burkholderia oklahomensis EO147]QPS39206.1 GNAT family N-acetyltransferase [Burkholderia oklahomensis]